ncbi:MAG: DUF502 domain-containing protein [Pseudomonadota bacterium]
MASYAAISAPLALLYLPLQVLIPAYYAQDLGLGFFAVGVALMLCRVFDVFTDPVVGWASERFTLPGGYRRPWLLAGTPVILLAVWMLFAPPADAGVAHLVIWSTLLYLAGRLLGSFVGRWFYARIEGLLRAIPGFKQVYPHVKQVVDLIMGDSKMAFSRVVLVEYPRKGIWTVGLVTSSSLKPVADEAGTEVLSVFIPTSPTPFTGFTINMPAADCVDVDMTIDQALRFVITAGVLVPEKHQMPAATGVPQLHVPGVTPTAGADQAAADQAGPDQVGGDQVGGDPAVHPGPSGARGEQGDRPT